MTFLLTIIFLFATAMGLLIVYGVLDQLAQRRKDKKEFDAEMLREVDD